MGQENLRVKVMKLDGIRFNKKPLYMGFVERDDCQKEEIGPTTLSILISTYGGFNVKVMSPYLDIDLLRKLREFGG